MSDPNVLFLIDGEIGVEINHLWCSVCWCGVPCDLYIKTTDKNRLNSEVNINSIINSISILKMLLFSLVLMKNKENVIMRHTKT